MKSTIAFLFVLLTALISGNGFAANELFRSISNGNWNSTLTWQMSTNGGSTWIAATSTPHDTSGAITIRNPNTVTVTANVTANQLTVDSGGVLAVNAGTILTLVEGSGNEITSSIGSIINGPGTVRTQGTTIEMNLRGGSLFNAQLNVNSGTTYAYDPNSPYDGRIFGSVTIDAGATLIGGNVSGRSLHFYGGVTNNGTLTASSTGGSIRFRGASLTNNGALSSAGSVYYDTTTSVSGNGTFTPANSFITANGNVTLLNSITYSPSSQITIETGGTLNPNGNTFTLTSGTMTVSLNATVSAPGTVRTQGTVALNLRAGSFFNAQLNVNSGTTFAYDQSAPYNGRIFGNVTIDAGATLNCGNTSGRSLQLYGNVTNNGTLTASSTGGSIRFRGASFTNNGALSPAGSVHFDTTTSVSGIGTFTPPNSYISANGNVTLLNSITYSPSSQITIETGGTLNPNGNTFTLISGTMTVSLNATVSSSGTVRTQGSVALNLRAGSFFNATLIVNSGTTFAYDQSAPYNGRIFGNVTIDAGATLNCGNISGRSLQLYGSVTNNGTLTTSSSGGSIRVRGSSLANNGLINPAGSFFFDTTTALSGTGSFTSGVSLSGNANVTLNSSHQMSAVTVNTGTSFNISNRWLRLTASNPLVVSGTFTATGSTVEYNGVAAQTVSATGITYSKIRINNSSGTTLAGNVTVNDSLIIQNGTLDINTRILTISPTGFLSESPGNVVKGSSGYLTTTRSINAPSSLDVGGFGAVLTTSANLGSTEIRRGHAVQTGGSIRRYYDITPANNSGLNATLKFRYDDSELNLRPEKAIKLFKSTNSGATWTNMGGTVNISTNEITITGLTSFSRWTADSTGVSAIISFGIEGYYNASNNRLRMEDTVRIYLRNISPPYSVVDSAVALLDSALLKAAFIFSNAPSGTYYIQVRHRNALETWSKSGGEQYIAGNTLNYDFLPSAATAFGSNQRQVDASPLRFAFYSGDVTQDGAIDGSDLSIIDNDAINFLSGYIVSDVNGDRFVDATDYSIADNNAANFISVARP